MLAKAIVKEIMGGKGIGMAEMSRLLGFKQPQKVTNRLSTDRAENISTDTLDEMLRVLGYKAIIVPENVRMKDGWYEIDDNSYKTGEK